MVTLQTCILAGSKKEDHILGHLVLENNALCSQAGGNLTVLWIGSSQLLRFAPQDGNRVYKYTVLSLLWDLFIVSRSPTLPSRHPHSLLQETSTQGLFRLLKKVKPR